MQKLLAISVLCLLPGCQQLKNYQGPSLRFSAGFEGVDIGVTILGKRGMSQAELVQALQKTGFLEPLPEIVGPPISATK